jgi:Uma2 family endonuclease
MDTVFAARDALSASPGPARISADEFLAMLDAGVFAGRRVELADGVIMETPPRGWTHAELTSLIAHLLRTVARAEQVVLSDITVRLGDFGVRDIDVALALRQYRKPGAAVPAAVALAVEVADSTLATDLHVKAAEYARAGIEQYWVVDAQAAVIHVHADPGASGYARRAVVRFGEPLSAPGGGTITIPSLTEA